MFISELTGLSFIYYKTGDMKKFRKNVAILTSLFLFILLFGIIRLTSYPTQFTDKKVRIVQGNISQEDKNNPSLSLSNLNEHLKLSYHTNKLDFIIWPEASIPYLYKENSVHLHEYLRSPLQENEYLVAGAVRKDLFTGKVHNSIVVIDHNGHNVAKYDKIRLLPFGEYIPFRKYLPFQSIASDIGDFDVGERSNVLTIKGMKIVLAICYEAVFPARFAHLSNDIDLIVNVTNDGWFGFTTEPFQHLQIVRARAIETGIPLIRVTNYGISAVYDPCGREITKISINESNAREVNIPLRIICTN
jgi:apolipoprotein N-acyltransferase